MFASKSAVISKAAALGDWTNPILLGRGVARLRWRDCSISLVRRQGVEYAIQIPWCWVA